MNTYFNPENPMRCSFWRYFIEAVRANKGVYSIRKNYEKILRIFTFGLVNLNLVENSLFNIKRDIPKKLNVF